MPFGIKTRRLCSYSSVFSMLYYWNIDGRRHINSILNARSQFVFASRAVPGTRHPGSIRMRVSVSVATVSAHASLPPRVYAGFSVFNQRRTARLGPISFDGPRRAGRYVRADIRAGYVRRSDRIPLVSRACGLVHTVSVSVNS